MLEEADDLREGEFESFIDTNSEYEYAMSPEPNIKPTQPTLAPVESVAECVREQLGLCLVANKEDNIIVSGGEFASDVEDSVDGDGQPMPVFSEVFLILCSRWECFLWTRW